MRTEEIIGKWLIEQKEDDEFHPFAMDEGKGIFILDGWFKIRNLALLLDERKVGGGSEYN